ncbi:CmcJ/NvfI family oxidoreductase [Scytonema hofmannii]|uniref:CmcJ/NvfI family oxidoreductase n=1 Tax=Scytonema hofmannii TaxID=34078 RepID=UPI00036AD572|nr:CmcJ/NvfI family oxidoreductase [Scytonema hofmannii]
MSVYSILILAGIFLLASIISVIAGSTSLITVPVMLEFGVEPRIAIATNMLALTLMSIGGTLPFIGKNAIDARRLPLLIVLTLIGSILGALLVLIIPSKSKTYSITYNPSHKWFYFPQMQPDEALFIKCFDSAEDGRARFAAHTGFDDPTSPPDAAPRQSIELRTVVFYPD